MTRFLLTTALVVGVPCAALADDILLRADITGATVFASGAAVERTATVTIPAGQHRLLIAMPDQASADLVQISGPDGVVLGLPQPAQAMPIAEGALDSAAEAEARAAVDAARDALLSEQDRLAAADGEIRAIEAQAAYLTALTRPTDGAAIPEDPAMVAQVLSTLGAESARVAAELQAAQIARRDLAEAVTEAQDDLRIATDAFQRLRPFGTLVDMVEVAITAEAETEADLTLHYLTPEAQWAPSYEIDLDSESGIVEIERFVTLTTYGQARWRDVAVTFSTATPDRARAPSGLSPDPVRIVEPVIVESRDSGRIAGAAMPAPAPVIAGVMAEDMRPRAQMQVEGLSISYTYGDPVTVGPSGEVVLPFDTLSLQMDTENRAVPRHDETAFLIALGENDSGAPILPGQTRFYRDGALIGEDWLPMIAIGAEMEIGFGPLDHLQLVWIDRSLAEGDRGLFVSSDTQVRELEFGVENTSDQAETVRLLYATPFTEQEDLAMDLTLDPAPDARDVDDMRGVHAWELQVAPGQRALIGMTVDLNWPEGMMLTWQP
ncbi:hypothetical protein roselon_01218 [Roseibacterium elongatum DSM 19469]|uniref:Aspartate ammonia-lyase n=1 Tax=Roseicyclus elongatus DSM 19469 TaxID=1294273 RepID=W8RR11_9RHOB|nr:DUF4139 domain-containing protein [Roseibacterium elongatum]AHM03609.1 hypothetical protein roselon_01218 [Roseibacterium elongatum DSM 19469]